MAGQTEEPKPPGRRDNGRLLFPQESFRCECLAVAMAIAPDRLIWVKAIGSCHDHSSLGWPVRPRAKEVRVMTTLQDFSRTMSRFVDGRRKRRQLERELAQLAAMGSLDAVLADVGLVRSQIKPLIEGCAGSRDLLDQMLARLGIDPAQLPVETLRDMTWTCTTCPDKRRCRKWLSDIGETDFHSFCPNAAPLDQFSCHRDPPAGGSPYDGTFYPSADDLKRMRTEARQREVRVLLDAAL